MNNFFKSNKIKEPNFCFIAPTEYLNTYSTQSKTHLVLAHLVETDIKYRDFYYNRSKKGDIIMMDCSAFELGESYPPLELVRLAKLCGAHSVVLPDYPFQHSSKTINAGLAIIDTVIDAGFSPFFVPQSETNDLEDWISSYEWASNNPNISIIGMSILGIPNAIPHIPKAYARVVMTQLLIDRGIFNFNKYHHYLGLNSAPNVELPSLIALNALDSCDSSNPIWCGINGWKYNTTQTDYSPFNKKLLREVDFAQHYSNHEHIHAIIQHNVDITKDIINNHTNYIN